jgi:uncharacterized protein (TIGR03032 family)
LERLGISLLISTYQAGKLMAVRAVEGKLATLLRNFDQVMGISLEGDRLAVGTRNQIFVFRNVPAIATQLDPKSYYDACYVPRLSYITGDIRVHELAWVQGELWMVNTRFSCLCTLHPDYSFVPQWQPPFITAIAPEDRCHLNGLALVDGKPKYVTTLSATDTAQGWRNNKAQSGCLIDVPSGEIIIQGLSMPHSPRVYQHQLWVLNSGYGQLVTIDPASGRMTVVANLPGFTRGLAFYDHYAFIGLSQIREKQTFGGLPIEEQLDDLQCAVWAIDLHTGQPVGFFKFESGCTELFDIQVVSTSRSPNILGFQRDSINHAFIL